MALKDNYLPIQQAAKELGVTRQTISRWIAKKHVPAERVGGVTLIKKDDLGEFYKLRLVDAVTASVVGLYKATVGDVFRESGRIAVKSNDLVNLSDEERGEVGRRMEPVLNGILREFFATNRGGISEDSKKDSKKRSKKPRQ